MSTNQTNQDDFLKSIGITPTNAFEGMSEAELKAANVRMEAEIKRLELEEKSEQLQDRKRKKQAKREEFEAKNRELLNQLARIAAKQRNCTHRKGGMGQGVGHPEPISPGDSDVYAVIKHQLPNGDWLVMCQRCGAEWMPQDKWSGRPASVIGGITYKEALQFRTDNTPSKSCVFNFNDSRTDEQVEKDRYKPPVDDAGNPVKDMRALPPAESFDQPSSPVRKTR